MPETNGLKTAVKNGELSPREALDKLQSLATVSGYKSKRLVNWLRRKDDATKS